MKILTPISDRFWNRVRITPGCWEWEGYIKPDGHGEIGKGRRGSGTILVHIFSFLLHGSTGVLVVVLGRVAEGQNN